MAKRVVKVRISGYYLVSDNLPEDVLGTATVEEFMNFAMEPFNQGNYDKEDLLELIEMMLEDMKTRPTVKLELKSES